jgi:hypothetical protein
MVTITADRPAGARPPLGALAGDLLRRARQIRGMSQRALAAAAGVSPTVVARIEAGTTQPTLTTLGRLLAGAGFAPSVDLVSTARPSALVSAHKEQLRALANRYRVRSIHVFGSAATGEDEPSVSGLDRIDFAEEVEKLLGIRVDMVNPAAAEPRFLRIIRPQLRPLDDF